MVDTVYRFSGVLSEKHKLYHVWSLRDHEWRLRVDPGRLVRVVPFLIQSGHPHVVFHPGFEIPRNLLDVRDAHGPRTVGGVVDISYPLIAYGVAVCTNRAGNILAYSYSRNCPYAVKM